MRNLTKVLAVAAMLAFPVASFAQTTAAPAAKTATKSTAAKSTAAKKPATKSATGTVKSISDSQLVITHGSGKAAKDETFVVNASTTKAGTIADGTRVSVHYTTEGTTMTATSIMASTPKKSSSKK